MAQAAKKSGPVALQAAKDRQSKEQGKSPVPPTTNVLQDQRPAVTGQDQSDTSKGSGKDGAKKTRKFSEQHNRYVATENFPDNAVITINRAVYEAKPKRRDAATRFSWYKDGMTVAEYKAAFKSHN